MTFASLAPTGTRRAWCAAGLAAALGAMACQAQREPATQPPAEAPAQDAMRYVLHDPPGVLTVRDAPVASAPVTLPAEVRQRLFSGGSAVPARAATLRLEGVVLPREAGVHLDVYLNNPRANAGTATTDPSFAGSLTLMRAAGDDPGGSINVSLGIAPLIHDLLRERSEISVTLVPLDSEGRPSSAAFGLDRIVLHLR